MYFLLSQIVGLSCRQLGRYVTFVEVVNTGARVEKMRSGGLKVAPTTTGLIDW